MKEIEELMKPRFKVIDGYPDSPFSVGDILYQHGNEGGFDSGFYYDLCEQFTHPLKVWLPGVIEKNPNIFKPLQWWEERSIEVMESVQYLKLEFNNRIQYVHKVERLVGENYKGNPLYEYFNRVGQLSTACITELVPATLEEYQSYQSINSLK